MIGRRALLLGFALAPASLRIAEARPAMTVFKDPNCGCCGAWVDHVRANGFEAEVRSEPAINRVKARLGVPNDLASCHTATINGFVLEGHVPAETIERLLRERPAVVGIAVPGMPIGSPGMEAPGQPPEPFKVIGFGPDGRRSVFAEYDRGYPGR